MTIFWSSWITIISIACWLFIAGILLFVIKNKPDLEDDGTTGHTYDGIQEYDKPLPKWWVIVFIGSLIWGVAYWVFFPAILPQSWAGITTVEVDGEQVPWTSANELNSELQSNSRVFTENFEKNILPDPKAKAQLDELVALQQQMRTSDNPPATLQADIDDKVKALAPYVKALAAGTQPSDIKAQMTGQRLFLQNCSVCHGSNAKGGTGYPNLTDDEWLYGGEPEDILLTLHNGRVGGMPAWREDIGEGGVKAVSEYVLSISGNQNDYDLDKTMVAQGEAIFKQPTNCVLCHGEDGKGMISAGAPNLTDKIWLYGGDRETIRDTLRHGRAGVMPAWQSKLGNERIMLLATYVYSLSQNGSIDSSMHKVQEGAMSNGAHAE